MKKILIIMVIFAISALMSACGEREFEDENNLTAEVKTEQGSREEQEKQDVHNVFGYKYCFREDVIGRTSTYGHVFENDDYSIFVFNGDSVQVDNVENAVEESKEVLASAVYSALRYYPDNQLVNTADKFTNRAGEILYKVEGEFESSDGDKEYLAYYHLTATGDVRFFIGLIDNNKDSLTEEMEYLAENLEKAE